MSYDGKVYPDDGMTSRERLLAAYRGEEVDRLPYWAKVINPTWRLSQPERVQALSDRELLDSIHADGIFHSPGFVRPVRPHVEVEESRVDHTRTIVTRTPDGPLIERWRMDPVTESWHPHEFPVKTREDLARFRWVYADQRVEVDEAELAEAEAASRQIGQRGILKTGWGTSPLMHLVEDVIGPVNTTYLLADHPDEMAELIDLMHRANLELVRALAERTPADLVVSVENTSTTLISPRQFETWCLPHLVDYGRAIEAAGPMHELHMCGLLKALLGRIETIPASSIEAFTAPPLGNTRLADGRAEASSKTLVGGTCVNIWLEPVERIHEFILEELTACPDHRRVVLTTAGVAPPACRAETFRAIGERLRTVSLRM